MSSHSASGRPANRLSSETSPYLLQHAHNPVDWYPWGEEAFARARAEDKPVFLSVGYSACHWCHVMERESFENDEIARLLNEHYISIKVDREERPDVDAIYMAAVQLITQRGGWPMSVFLTPDGEPFYGGTYWPPTSRMGMPGFRDILLKLHDYWKNRRDEVIGSAGQLVEAVGRVSRPEFETTPLDTGILQHAMQSLLSTLDRRNGGFGGAPKFPHPMDLRVLLRCWRRFGHEDALAAVRLTLDRMAAGGIYDHLGGGFHRYSTDAHWLVPHFEKMLYDNALLVPTYLEARQCLTGQTGDGTAETATRYERVVRETLDYILREMTQSEGGFYSTQDADSEGEEGKFFVWTADEIEAVLGKEAARLFCAAYDVHPAGNWEGVSILNRPLGDEAVARSLGIDAASLRQQLDLSRQKLFAHREQRVHPGRDDKVLSGWNGLMIAAMAMAGRVLEEPRYITAARDAATFLFDRMRDESGQLLHSFKDGRARFAAYLDDYACVIDGLVELYQATFEPDWLEAALELAGPMERHFADIDGGFFYTADDHERLITRTKDSQDNATPSGNGMAATALLRLGRLTGRSDLEESGYRTLVCLSGLLAEHPRAAGQSLMALDFHLGPSFEVALVDGPDRRAGDTLIRTLNAAFAPHIVQARRPVDVEQSALPEGLQSLFAERPASTDAQVYVCERGTCRLPVSDAAALMRELSLPAPSPQS